MSTIFNPHPPQIPDEASGCEVPHQRHQDWQAGYDVGHEVGLNEGIDLMFQALRLLVGARRFQSRRKEVNHARTNTR